MNTLKPIIAVMAVFSMFSNSALAKECQSDADCEESQRCLFQSKERSS